MGATALRCPRRSTAPKKGRATPELDFQKLADEWLELHGLLVLPLNSGESVTKAARVAGIPDRAVVLPNGVMVYLELKRPDGKGRLRPAQKEMLLRLNRQGAPAAVVKSLDEIAAVLRLAGWNGERIFSR